LEQRLTLEGLNRALDYFNTKLN